MGTITLLIICGLLGIFLALAIGASFYFTAYLKRINADVAGSLKQINENLTFHLKDSLKMLHETNQHVGSRLDSAAKVIGDVKQHLGKLEESNIRIYEIGKDIAGLQDLLRAPKIRGGIGEYILEDLLRQIIPKEYYTLQHEFKNKERVDAVIRFGEGMVPIDAKFPLENFKRMLAAKGEKDYLALKKSFISDIRNHIKKISDKYIVPTEGTFDFALMYIPAENVYYETIIKDEKIDRESGIFQYAINKKVIPVSPNSFYAYLRVILLGLKGMAIEKNAKGVLLNLSRLRGEFDRFAEDFAKIGRHLNSAKINYSDSEKRLIKLTDRLSDIESLGKPDEKAKIAN